VFKVVFEPKSANRRPTASKPGQVGRVAAAIVVKTRPFRKLHGENERFFWAFQTLSDEDDALSEARSQIAFRFFLLAADK
jgi:hypothetical protein